MGSLDLNTLLDWTRRHGGDLVTASTESITSDGTATVTINASGAITVTLVTVDGEELDPAEYTSEGNLLTLYETPVEGAAINVSYQNSRFTDDEMFAFIFDATRGVKADMGYGWLLNESTKSLSDNGVNEVTNDSGVVRPEIEQLIVYRAAVEMSGVKADQASDDSIKIRDGDTSIDTSTTADQGGKVLQRKQSLYEKARDALMNKDFRGVASGSGFFHRPVWR